MPFNTAREIRKINALGRMMLETRAGKDDVRNESSVKPFSEKVVDVLESLYGKGIKP